MKLRVVAGERKGIPLKAISGTTTRPTADKVKESIFNIIGPFFDGGTALDLFAGSGGLGIEALSRGAERAIFVEKDRKAFHILKENIKKCRYEDRSEMYCTEAGRAVRALLKRDIQIDYVFADPPYKKLEYYDYLSILAEGGKLSRDAIIVCEHSSEVQLPKNYGQFVCVREETYGNTNISIYRMN